MGKGKSRKERLVKKPHTIADPISGEVMALCSWEWQCRHVVGGSVWVGVDMEDEGEGGI